MRTCSQNDNRTVIFLPSSFRFFFVFASHFRKLPSNLLVVKITRQWRTITNNQKKERKKGKTKKEKKIITESVLFTNESLLNSNHERCFSNSRLGFVLCMDITLLLSHNYGLSVKRATEASIPSEMKLWSIRVVVEALLLWDSI